MESQNTVPQAAGVVPHQLHPFYKNFIVHSRLNAKCYALSDDETIKVLIDAGLVVQIQKFSIPLLTPLGREAARQWVLEGFKGDAPISKEAFYRLHSSLEIAANNADTALRFAEQAVYAAKVAREAANSALDRYKAVFGGNIRIEDYPSEIDLPTAR